MAEKKDTSWVREALYNRYILPTEKKREKFIGIEVEMPIVNLSKEAVDFTLVHSVTRSFMEHFDFEATGLDENGNVYSAVGRESGDILSFDCSYNNLEISLGKQKELFTAEAHFKKYYDFLLGEFKKSGHTLTGMGINPYRKFNLAEPVPNGRYRMLLNHLRSKDKYADSLMYFHPYPEYGLYSSASQVQLDVEHERLIDTINTFGRLEPIKALLFSNALLLPEHPEMLNMRDIFWENSTHGINPHNIGMFDCELESVDELLDYICATSIYCAERNGKYINFTPIPVMDYFSSDTIRGEYYDSGSCKEISFSPESSDLKYLRSFKFEDLTFRGTIEHRSVCCQPIKDLMTVSAYHTGLNERLDELKELLYGDRVIYGHGYTKSELRKLFNKRELPSFINRREAYKLALSTIQLAEEGLKDRGLGEEVFLSPLYERAESMQSPALYMLTQLEAGRSLEELIIEFS